MTDVTHRPPTASTPSPAAPAPRDLQPLLHELASCVAAPGLLLADPDGQVRPGGVSGWYAADVRLLDVLELAVDGSDLDLVRATTRGADRQDFSYVARGLGDPIPDPTVRIDRSRVLRADGLVETLVVTSSAQEPVSVTVRLSIGSDLAPMSVVKQGGRGAALAPATTEASLSFASDRAACRAVVAPAPTSLRGDDAGGVATWTLHLSRGESETLELRADGAAEGVFTSGLPAPWDLAVEAADLRVRRTCEQGLADLAGLLLRDGDDRFLAAGSPWFLTLFGRDTLWAARMLLPLDSGLALSTLRVLARRQGTRDDPATEEQPGKILHEVRAGELDLGAQVLPPVYYGSVDATPLFVATLADAHAWGADPAGVEELLPAARRCLEWLLAQSGSGWLRYVDSTGRGLSNQGWKDSHDSVQHADGRLAEAPIALCEVQAYAYDAARRGAALLEHFGQPPVAGLTAWAEDLRSRFDAAFWVDGAEHPAIALDAHDRQADSLTSNIGHLLGTGVLSPAHTERVAELLVDPRLDSGFGLRTLAEGSPRFSLLSYHGGTVWPHDTAVAARGLAAEGRYDEAAQLAAGVVAAAEGTSYRLPELYGGDAAAAVPFPSAYPAACRPQAWAAAAPIAMLVAVSGLVVDAPAGRLSHPARTSTRLGAYSLLGLRVGTEPIDLHVAGDGTVRVDTAPGSRLVVERRATTLGGTS